VLQIVTKRYFRRGVPLNSTVHRRVIYTNRDFLRGDPIVLPVGELAPSTDHHSVSSVTVSVTEHLEAEYPDGETFGLVATSGDELLEQLADVLSFGFNAVFSSDGDLVRRLVPTQTGGRVEPSASQLFRRTFDPALFVGEEELDEFREFMTSLLGLRRENYEAAMRAIGRIVHATQRAVINPTIAYVDLVAALESLSEGASAPPPSWQQLDGRKRNLFDDALSGADRALSDRVRRAAMDAERLGSTARFVAFVTDHLSPSFFRAEAAGVVRPIRGADLDRALKTAYGIRSRNVHALEALPPEAWLLGEPSDTAFPPGLGTILSLDGLARLARHVVRNYIDRAPTDIDLTFNWRAALPGMFRAQLAPQYWIWQADGFSNESAPRYFSGLVANLTDAGSGQVEAVAPMAAVLERIEEILPGTGDGEVKAIMVAIYALWHGTVARTEHRRPGADDVLSRHEGLLKDPSVAAFAVGLLSGEIPDWSVDQWLELATERRLERESRSQLELVPSVDAALQVVAAEELVKACRLAEAQRLASLAVEELPGNEELITWEERLVAGKETHINLGRLLFGPGRDDRDPT